MRRCHTSGLTFNPLTAKIFTGTFTHLKLFLADAIHNYSKLSIFHKMVISDFEVLLIYVMFYLSHVQKLVFNVLIKN